MIDTQTGYDFGSTWINVSPYTNSGGTYYYKYDNSDIAYSFNYKYDVYRVKSVTFDDKADDGMYTINLELKGLAELCLKMPPRVVEELLDILDRRYDRVSKEELEVFFGET